MKKFLALMERLYGVCAESGLHPRDQISALDAVHHYIETGPYPEDSNIEFRKEIGVRTASPAARDAERK